MPIDLSMIPEWMLPDSRRPELNHPFPEDERAWKDRIILRDGNRCRFCERHTDHAGPMDVHHVTYERFGFEEDRDGILLCRDKCHPIVTVEQRRRLSFSRKETSSLH